MPALTDAELTVLGLLVEQPRHGYELERVIEERGIRAWTALGFSSIYYVLDKLAKRGLIEATGGPRSGKSRATFQATPSGVELCADATREALTTLTPVHARVLIAMANSPGLPDADVHSGLTARLTAVREQLAEVRATRTRQEPLPDAAAAIFDYSEAMLTADLTWTESVLSKETAMEKYDVKKAHRTLYAPPSKDFTVVDVPALQYLAVDGHGDPNTAPEYTHAVEALYGIAYSVKFASKKTLGRDFVVGPLEGLWRADDPTVFLTREKAKWDWTMMINQPDWVTEEMVREAAESVAKKKDNPALARVQLRTLTEGTSVQILHLGSYDDETPTLHRLHDEYLPEHDLTFNGDHHEVYLSDPRRTAPEKLKTVLRQPVKPLRTRSAPAES
ncbi:MULTISPECIES: GyrI-like domain-containing protein [Amycolatopsis]|uniref:GyrI-like domain-containing protein n=1 Tax=Amycolatopsis dendrobii TaxID=2760662 RepID=A0A7W3ZC05_9PSEU|nr:MULTISPECIES: GyrI-like domain-containing protein [Amycolatopsis]MBB1155412.1 GyrI-like domain-containing protein [Amycolatopsis dendrobii]UKD54651.1 GyrI-like domain-containing protein [Amycolatopsis sp. FU40]